MGGHPLRSPTRHRLGEPLPHQLADGTQVPPKANSSFSYRFLNPITTCGISSSFELLSHTLGQVTNALLTRSPLRTKVQVHCFSVRLACIRHAASVHPEPGSNSPQKFFTLTGVKFMLRSKTTGLSYFLSLFSCQGSVNQAGCILPAIRWPVKSIREINQPMSS